MFALAMASAGPLRPAPREREGVEAPGAGREREGVGHPQHISDSGCCRKVQLRPLSIHCGHSGLALEQATQEFPNPPM